MDSKLILNFLRQLEQNNNNNNKVWFDAHRDVYTGARQEWLKFTEQLLGHLGEKIRSTLRCSLINVSFGLIVTCGLVETKVRTKTILEPS